MELNISELRRQKRPLWMTEFDEECSADILGGGGDIYADRLPIDSARGIGEEYAVDDESLSLLEGREPEEDFLS